MVSLSIWCVMLAASLAATTAAVAWAARAAGSPRAGLGRAAGAVGVLVAAGLAMNVAIALAPAAGRPAAAIGGPAVQLGIAHAVFRRTFRLSAGRAFAPLGALLAVTVIDLAVALAVVRPFLAEGFILPTGSMAPTLLAGDHVAANKVVRPRRFDLVVYHTPDGTGDVYCKRLIGLPGESLTFTADGGLLVDGRPVAVPPVLAGRCHAAGPPGTPARYADGRPIPLGDRQYFLIGDNVGRSWDCRMTGPADAAAIIGVADAVYWPPARSRLVR